MTRRITRMLIALFTALGAVVLAPSALADGLIVITNPPDHPHPHPHPHYRFAPLEVREHHVNVSVTDQVAVTVVNQTFYNPHHQQLEGEYLFPVPKGAQIDSFSMDINGEMVQAELLDADKARKIYTDIVRKMRDPALMEYIGQELFKVRIFPIEGQSEKKVNLKYTEVLHRDGDMIGYRYPLNTEKFSAAPIRSLSLAVTIDSSSPVTTLYSPSHEIDIKRNGDKRATVGFEQSNVRPDHDFQLYFGVDDSATSGLGFSVLTYRPQSGEPGYFMLLAAPTVDTQDQQILPKDVVFVLDTSGSMAGKKLEQAQNALRFCLANLNDDDRFDIVRFSTDPEALFSALTDADDNSRDMADAFIDGFKARGGTDIKSALQAAIDAGSNRDDAERPFMIIFLTDGRPTVGTTDTQQIVSAAAASIGERTTRIFCFGIGTEINTHLLDKIAMRTRAVTEYVLPEEDIEVKVSRFYTKVDSPVLANPKLSVQGPVTFAKMQPRALPDVFKDEQVVVFGRYNGSGDAAIAIDGNLAGTQRTLMYEASFAPHQPDNVFIARLWATRRIGWLLDEIRLHGDSDELRDEVTQLAREFGIVTPYTSYLILEDESMPLAFRAAPTRDADASVAAGAEAYGQMKSVSTGRRAVDTSARQRRMQDEVQVAGSADSPQEQARLLGLHLADSRASQSRPVQYVRGRSFYFTGEQWIDSTIDDDADSREVSIEPFSDAYFELIDQHPDAAAWLAVGDRVQLRLGDTVYIIEPQSE